MVSHLSISTIWSYLDVLTFLLFGDEGSGGAQDCFLLCTLVTPATGPFTKSRISSH